MDAIKIEESFRFFDFKEGKFFYNTNFDYTNKKDSKRLLGLETQCVYKDGSDAVYFRMLSKYEINDTLVMSYEMSLGFLVKDWSESLLKLSIEELKQNEVMLAMTDAFVGFFRGALAVHAKGSKLENSFIPMIPSQNIIKSIDFRKIEE